MNKIEMTEAIFAAKSAKGVSWAEIGAAVGLSDVFISSVTLGQNSLIPEDAARLASFLELSPE